MFSKLQAFARACPTCTLICQDATLRRCECCGGELPVGPSSACIDLEEEDRDEPPLSQRSCPACTLICDEPLRSTCGLCGTELPSCSGLVYEDIESHLAGQPVSADQPLTQKRLRKSDAPIQRSLSEYLRTPANSSGSQYAPIDDATLAPNSALPEGTSKFGHLQGPATKTEPPPASDASLLSAGEFDAGSSGLTNFRMAAASQLASVSPSCPPLGELSEGADMSQPLSAYEAASACWRQHGAPVPYRHIAKTFDTLEGTRSRLAKEAILTNCFRSMLALGAPRSEVEAACYLLSPAKDAQTGGHRLRPDWAENSKPLGITNGSIVGAVLEATGASRAEFRRCYGEIHDTGEVALTLRERGGQQQLLRRPAPLTARHVRSVLVGLADIAGHGAEKRKLHSLVALLRAAVGTELKWLVRTFIPHMSVGISLEASVLPALGAAAVIHSCEHGKLPTTATIREAQEAVRGGFALRPDVGTLVDALLKDGIDGVRSTCNLHVGVPMQPMLAKASTSVQELIKRITAALSTTNADGSICVTAEHKYDGQRAQIHRDTNGKLRIFSRKIDDMTYKYPDIAANITRASKSRRAFVLDAEVVPLKHGAPMAVDKTIAHQLRQEDSESIGVVPKKAGESQLASFQSLSTRKRKNVTAANAAVESVAVKLFIFDLLLLGDQVLLNRPLSERRAAMREEFVEEKDVVAFASAVDVKLLSGEPSSGNAPLDAALLESIDAGCEGLMVKRLDSSYEPSTKRSDCWLKLKKDYLDNMGDSLDLIPIGGWRGQGRKSRWISPWLVATYDPIEGVFGSVCRVMSGFTDQFYHEQTLKYMGAEFSMGKRSVADAGKEEADVDPDVLSDVGAEDDGGSDGSVARPDDDADAVLPVPGEACNAFLRTTPAPGVQTREKPQFWFEPSEVWEIKCADITVSPKHLAAQGFVDPDRGLSLRFPRFMRVRSDKCLSDATTPEQLVAMFRKQTQQH